MFHLFRPRLQAQLPLLSLLVSSIRHPTTRKKKYETRKVGRGKGPRKRKAKRQEKKSERAMPPPPLPPPPKKKKIGLCALAN